MRALSFGARDPWWDLEGKTVRRRRRLRRLAELLLAFSSLVLLVYAYWFRPAAVRAAVTSIDIDPWTPFDERVLPLTVILAVGAVAWLAGLAVSRWQTFRTRRPPSRRRR